MEAIRLRETLLVIYNMDFTSFCLACYGRNKEGLSEQHSAYLHDKYDKFRRNQTAALLELDGVNMRRLARYCEIRIEYNNGHIPLETYQNRVKELI